ncbi:MAG TPA: hypothetical protein VJ933_04805 [Phaeodactylibacter sp.]|nr:hypothetical protein [Phaeodactylibacter sp.]
MKQLLGLCLALSLSLFFACGQAGDKTDQAVTEELERLDSMDNEIRTAVNKLEEDAAALESALDSLETLFPEEAETE